MIIFTRHISRIVSLFDNSFYSLCCMVVTIIQICMNKYCLHSCVLLIQHDASMMDPYDPPVATIYLCVYLFYYTTILWYLFCQESLSRVRRWIRMDSVANLVTTSLVETCKECRQVWRKDQQTSELEENITSLRFLLL